VRTIEDELINALYKAEAITEDGKANLGKVGFGAHLMQYKYYLIAQHVICLLIMKSAKPKNKNLVQACALDCT